MIHIFFLYAVRGSESLFMKISKNGILDEYDVDEQTATADVLEFISYLKSNNIIDD